MVYFTHPEDQDSAFFKVEGWVNKYMPEVMRFAVGMMKTFGVQPRSAGEIGVHHGRFFLVLEELCDEVGYCDAYDVFEDQFRNLDGSGRGSEKKFLANVEAFAKASSRVRAFKAALALYLSLDRKHRFRMYGENAARAARASGMPWVKQAQDLAWVQ